MDEQAKGDAPVPADTTADVRLIQPASILHTLQAPPDLPATPGNTATGKHPALPDGPTRIEPPTTDNRAPAQS